MMMEILLLLKSLDQLTTAMDNSKEILLEQQRELFGLHRGPLGPMLPHVDFHDLTGLVKRSAQVSSLWWQLMSQ